MHRVRMIRLRLWVEPKRRVMEEEITMTIVGVHVPLGKRGMRGMSDKRDIREKRGVKGLIEEKRIRGMIKQVITSFDIQDRKRVRLITLPFGDYSLIWWTFMMDDIRKERDLFHLQMQETYIISSRDYIKGPKTYRKPSLERVKRPQCKIPAWSYATLEELVHQEIKVEM
ncbi:hypothetical protein CR513_47482, partial [Mucuna pruriens]